jgi:hypothetical protein
MDNYPEQQKRPAENFVTQEIPTPVTSDEIWKLILDRNRIPDAIIHMMKGEAWEDGLKDGVPYGKWVIVGEPLMNDKGIKFFTPILYSLVTPDKLTTFISEEEFNRLMHEFMDAIIYVIMERGDEFGIPASNRDVIIDMFEKYAVFSFSASRKGTILAALKPAYERKELYTPYKPQGGFRFPSFLGGQG